MVSSSASARPQGGGYTKENLQATIEELETSNEELQATNEERVASVSLIAFNWPDGWIGCKRYSIEVKLSKAKSTARKGTVTCYEFCRIAWLRT